MRSLSVALFLMVLSNLGLSQDLAQKDYAEKLQRLNRRYEGFFLHQRDQSRFQVRRTAGIPKLKASRRAYAEKREASRRGFVRQPPKDMEPARLRWEAQQEKKRQSRMRSRSKFAKQRAKLDAVEQSAKKIPEMQELGIE